MDDPRQLSLFGDEPEQAPPVKGAAAKEEVRVLQEDTPLIEALDVYVEALRLAGSSPYTIKAFRSDLHLLELWGGSARAIGSYGTQDLNQFLRWMTHERGKPCSPKTYARRVTTLKNFFGYLFENEAIRSDPSNAVIQKSVTSPLPDVLTEEEVRRVLAVTVSLRDDPRRPDARPHLLVTLLLDTGIKKSECMGLHISDIMREHPEGPKLWVRYANPQMRYKERRLVLLPMWIDLLDEYVRQRKVTREIFDCTARNLEYVLRDVGRLAGLEDGRVSFETLRWTCALRDWLDGMAPDRLRQKLGISRVTWAATSDKLAQLAKDEKDEGF